MSSSRREPQGLSAPLTIALIGAALIIAAFPMFFNLGDPSSDEPFAGTDSAAESVVGQQNPDYEPWSSPLIGELPGEVESGLFALQAALGAGILGFALGNYRGASKAARRAADDATPESS